MEKSCSSYGFKNGCFKNKINSLVSFFKLEIIQSEVLDWFPFSSARLEPYVLVQLCFKVPASVSVSSNVLNGPYGVTVAFLCRADENITLGFFLSTAEYHCFVLC